MINYHLFIKNLRIKIISHLIKLFKPYDIHIATKQIWALNQTVRLSKLSQDTLDDIENGYMSPP